MRGDAVPLARKITKKHPKKEDNWIKWNCRIRNVTVMVKVSCNNVPWEVYIGVSLQGGAPIGPSPLLKINKSPSG